MDIKNAKVIVTGGSSGIGYEAAKMLKANGAQVVICGTDPVALKQAAAELAVTGFRADVTQEHELEALFKFAVEHMDGLNVLINNAGIGRYNSITDTTSDEFQTIWEVNVKGVFIAGKLAARHFIASGSGNIINIGSTAALRGYANGSAYVASKFAVSGLTECWRAELRPHNIRVMQINPSEVVTEFLSGSHFQHANAEKKLKPADIGHLIIAMLSMNDIGFIPDASVWATNPW